MRAILKIPFEAEVGYLVWATPYVFPDEELAGIYSIVEFEQLGYEVEPYDSDGGIVFKGKDNYTKLTIGVVSGLFPWMEIGLTTISNELTFENFIFESQLVLLPISRVELHSPIYTEDCMILPAGWLDIDSMNLGDMSRVTSSKTQRDLINETTRFSLDFLKKLPLALVRKEIPYEDYLKMRHSDDNDYIKELSSIVESVMDVVRFEMCNYSIPGYLPSRVGKYYDRYSAAATFFPAYRIGFFQARQVDIKTISTGLGLQIEDTDRFNYHRLFRIDLGETGQIVKHALKLHTQIQESDNESLKFTQIFTLLEFIGSPEEYMQIQKSKKIVFATIAKDQIEFDKLKSRIEKLTSGLKNKDGDRDPVGYRTDIIHNGKLIEKLLPDASDRKKLFDEMYDYIYKLLHFMILHIDKSWDDFEKVRLEMRSKFH